MSQKRNIKGRKHFPLFNGPAFEITETIFNYPSKVFHIRGLAKETKLSTTSVIRTIEELRKYNIVKIEKTDITSNIRANLESEACIFFKKIFNLYRIKRCAIIDLVVEKMNPEAIVLFGSYANGEDIEKSDIDLLILSNSKQTNEFDFDKFEKELTRKINIYILPDLEKSSSEFKNNIANGIVLYGYLKVI